MPMIELYRFRSLDDVWYFGGGAGRKQKALLYHEDSGSKDGVHLRAEGLRGGKEGCGTW